MESLPRRPHSGKYLLSGPSPEKSATPCPTQLPLVQTTCYLSHITSYPFTHRLPRASFGSGWEAEVMELRCSHTWDTVRAQWQGLPREPLTLSPLVPQHRHQSCLDDVGHPSGAVHRWDDHWGRGRQFDSLSREADPSSGHRIGGTTHRSNFQIYDATNILTVTDYLPEA